MTAAMLSVFNANDADVEQAQFAAIAAASFEIYRLASVYQFLKSCAVNVANGTMTQDSIERTQANIDSMLIEHKCALINMLQELGVDCTEQGVN